MLQKILGLLYPERCIFCNDICKEGICSKCKEKVHPITEPRCKKCGKPVQYEEQEFCYDCRNRNFHYEQGRSLWLHEGLVKKSIYGFKYKNRRVYAKVYAREMMEQFLELLKIWKIDVIVPVPLHKKRYRKRGYNQAFLLADEISKITGIQTDEELVVRKRDTDPQKEFGNKDRKKNLKGAFEVTKRGIKNRRILIVDDIYTTGSTIDEIAEILKKAGAGDIFFLTISIGQGF